MSGKKRDFCCNCGRKIELRSTPFFLDAWFHVDDDQMSCNPALSVVLPIGDLDFRKHVANPRDQRWESVYVVTERVKDEVDGERIEHTFISIQLVFFGIQLSQNFHLHPESEGEKYHWIEKGIEAMDAYLEEAGFKQ